jgi:hypothetical protein
MAGLGTHNIVYSYTSTTTGCTGHDTTTIQVHSCVGAPDEAGSSDVVVFPNPFSDQLVIQMAASTNATTIRIFSPDGRSIADYKNHGKKLVINTSEFGPGVYILSIRLDERNYIRKVVCNP